MAGKSPEQAPREETPKNGGSRGPDPSATEGPSSIPPTPVISPLLARRLGARVLDPDTATLAPGQPTPLPTVYVGDTLLVRDVRDPELDAGDRPTRVDELVELASKLPDPFVVEPVGEPLSIPARGEVAENLGPDAHVTVTRIRLSRDPAKASKLPDAWRFFQTALMQTSERGSLLYDKLGLGRLPTPDGELDDTEKKRRERRDRRGRSMASGVSVEHVLTAGGGVWGGGGGVWGGGGGVWGGGGGVWGGGGGVWGGGGLLAEYGTPGIGGRSPVVWSAPDPRKAVTLPADAPVIAVLDTGLGQHTWFPDEAADATAEKCTGSCPGAHRRVTFGGEPIGVWKEPSRDPENTGVIIDDVNGLVDVLCGHGTFIAGVIRQRCPEAVILAVPVMASDGAALEDDIVRALSALLDRHRAAKAAPGTITHGVIDVVNLSLGYYHETPDEADDTALADLLREFADEGVVVVACAGNDATRARFFPAAFAEPGHEGLVGVGATNPDDRSIALFSNVGDWVTAHAPGAGVVSTVPTTLSGSLNPLLSVDGFGPGPRSGVDFDDFRSGFAVWSGTSFAAPWIVGEIAAQIVGGGVTVTGTQSRARAASTQVVAQARAERFPEEDA
jgi:hypothetical protein